MCDAVVGKDVSSRELMEAVREAPPRHVSLIRQISQLATRIKPIIVARHRMAESGIFSAKDIEIIDSQLKATKGRMDALMKQARRFQGRVAECRRLLKNRAKALDAIDAETGILRSNPKLLAAFKSRHKELSKMISQ